MERRCVSLCNSWEIWEFTANHRQRKVQFFVVREEDLWEVVFLSEVVCGMENCEPLGEEQPKQGLRYLCMEASSSELFS